MASIKCRKLAQGKFSIRFKSLLPSSTKAKRALVPPISPTNRTPSGILFICTVLFTTHLPKTTSSPIRTIAKSRYGLYSPRLSRKLHEPTAQSPSNFYCEYRPHPTSTDAQYIRPWEKIFGITYTAPRGTKQNW
jgi:hypothetical protein